MNSKGRRVFAWSRSVLGILPLGLLVACASDGDTGDVGSAVFGLEGTAGSAVGGSTSIAGSGGAGAVSSGGKGGSIGGEAGSPSEGGAFGEDPEEEPSSESAFYQFDDCSSASTTLIDSSPTGANATRASGVTCATSIQGLAVDFDGRQDVVTAPKVQELEFSQNLAVAAWVNARSSKGMRVIAQKGEATNFTFNFAIKDGDIQFQVTLSNGRKFTSAARISTNEWVHVAGLFDGSFVFLFVNGERVGQVSASGTLKTVDAPVRIGSNPQRQNFDGLIDNVWLSSNPVDEFELTRQACITQDPLVEVTPATSGLVEPDTTVNYDVKVTNRDVGAGCFPADIFLSINQVPSGFQVSVENDFEFLEPGQSTTFPVAVTGSVDAEPGVNEIPFDVIDFNQFRFVSDKLVYELAEPTGCFVRSSRELMIRHVSVVDDPIRTNFDGDPDDPRTGAWTFARLMRDMAPSPEQAPDMVEAMVNTWLEDQTVNGFSAGARPAIQELVLDNWPRTEDGKLDLEQAPMRLLAIVNRFDVRNLAQGHAGEGRFIFGVLSPFGPLEFTMIAEYRLPASTAEEVQGWADSWHALGALPFPSEEYNAALQALTSRFAGRGAEPGRPNGSALAQFRTNEIALDFEWQLREFHLSPESGMLVPATVALTPDPSFNFSSALADFVNQNEASILLEQHVVPETFQSSPFLGSHVENQLSGWFAEGINNLEARHKFSLNTCNGCHSFDETGTSFLHVFPRDVGNEASLSGFLTGISVFDPFSGEVREMNDLKRRRVDLEGIVCEEPALAATTQSLRTTSAPTTAPTTSLTKGIQRVH